MTIINMTPHTITVVSANEVVATFPSEGVVRVASKEVVVGDINGIPQTATEYGAVEGLPAQTNDTIYIVSRLVLAALEKAGITRSDLRVPGMQVRNEAGQVVGCKSLALN